ncbi:unnamed protein product [Owenia fusiformis]|uniref:Uncharacterized protein n=1 Tax=Owenia fusiformis TaxID=6347 RepID=A0A8J1UJV8_OWEFU|nr:unnamed protein product [Owenia fusiformis]
MSDVKCNGDEMNIAECTFKLGDEASCLDGTKANVYCHQLDVWKPRKKGSSSELIKNSLIMVDVGKSQWRWICGDGMDKRTGGVVCFAATNSRRALTINEVIVSTQDAARYIQQKRFHNTHRRHHIYRPKEFAWPVVKVKCEGDEYSLGQCDIKETYNCTNLAFLKCGGPSRHVNWRQIHRQMSNTSHDVPSVNLS